MTSVEQEKESKAALRDKSLIIEALSCGEFQTVSQIKERLSGIRYGWLTKLLCDLVDSGFLNHGDTVCPLEHRPVICFRLSPKAAAMVAEQQKKIT